MYMCEDKKNRESIIVVTLTHIIVYTATKYKYLKRSIKHDLKKSMK